jgi:DNA-binding transcriptional MerR regulator
MDKTADAFRTISEVAEEIDVPQHVLRFWEKQFSQIRPMKRTGGRRYYRREDVELVSAIKALLYGQGYTIRGVQRILKEQGVRATIAQVTGEGIELAQRTLDFEVPPKAEASTTQETIPQQPTSAPLEWLANIEDCIRILRSARR